MNPMLALRNSVCNDRWQEMWQTANQQRRDLQAQCRHDRAIQRQEALRETLKKDLVEPPPSAIPLAPLLPPDPPAMIPGISRPSEHHSWKRGPACTPKQFAKR